MRDCFDGAGRRLAVRVLVNLSPWYSMCVYVIVYGMYGMPRFFSHIGAM